MIMMNTTYTKDEKWRNVTGEVIDPEDDIKKHDG